MIDYAPTHLIALGIQHVLQLLAGNLCDRTGAEFTDEVIKRVPTP